VLATAAFGVGALAGAVRGPDERGVAERYVRAWERGDYAAMYRELSPAARRRVGRARFAELHRLALATATARSLAAGRAGKPHDGTVAVPMVVRTRIFGTVRAPLVLPVTGSGSEARVDWRRSLTFPGVPPGAELTREVTMPPRATLLARDGKILAQGAARTPSPALADVAADTVGQLGPAPAERQAELMALGVPPGQPVGVSGLERALDVALLGRPGGRLLGGTELLASSAPRQAPPVRTSIAPSVERAAIAGLAGRLGGIVALDPRTGELLGFAGIAFSGLQPPGSTFKILTLTGALEAGVAKPTDAYAVETAATLEGVQLENANGESCGGSLANAFAESCNSVFAPLGARLGAQRLVATAEHFGFNAPPGIPGAATSTIPAAGDIGDDLAVGSTAIGQGRVQATALQMASIAATIGLRGRRPRLRLTLDDPAAGDTGTGSPGRATSPAVARTVEKLMLGVVRHGTGTAAALPGVRVAGKTGTAELQTTRKCAQPTEPDAAGGPAACAPDQSTDDPTDTDAWFAAYAPAGDGRPRAAVGVLLVRSGAGGTTAAPVAREVLRAMLQR
jgi:cell division protein FtsI/penicillin-binding protein 2